MTTIDRLQLRLQSAMDDWDIHIEGCPDGLVIGMRLCAEGAYLGETADALRSKLASRESAKTQESRTESEVGQLNFPMPPGLVRAR